MLKAHNNSNIEQLGICSVWLRHDIVRGKFFVGPDNGLVLVGVPDIELSGLLKIMCKVLDQQQVSRKFDLQTRDTSVVPESITNKTSTSNAGNLNNCIKLPDYVRPSANGEVDKEVSRILTEKIHNDFSDIFIGISCFESTFKLQVRESSCPYKLSPRRVVYTLQRPIIEELGMLQNNK